MSAVATKLQILDEAGYAYSIDRGAYLNKDARKIFSIEFVQDHSEGELAARINEPGAPAGEWRFYFNAEPSEGVKRELLSVLANGRADSR